MPSVYVHAQFGAGLSALAGVLAGADLDNQRYLFLEVVGASCEDEARIRSVRHALELGQSLGWDELEVLTSSSRAVEMANPNGAVRFAREETLAEIERVAVLRQASDGRSVRLVDASDVKEAQALARVGLLIYRAGLAGAETLALPAGDG